MDIEPDASQSEPQTKRSVVELLRVYSTIPQPPPPTDAHAASLVWGLAQPLLGMRVLLRHRDLLARTLVPVVAFLLICAVFIERSGAGVLGWVQGYYLVVIAAAPISPVLFHRLYSRLAARARPRLGVREHAPYLRSFRQALLESILQLLVVGLGVAPIVGIIQQLPVLGTMWAAVIGYAWAMHWIVVEALDSARTLPPGVEPATLEARHRLLDPPWYAAPTTWRLRSPFAILLLPIRWWAAMTARMSRRWRGEVLVIETRPWIAGGFALGTAVLLAIPILNLLFRPAVIVAATHVLGRLEDELPEPEPVSPTEPFGSDGPTKPSIPS